jgi:hypothetical protein
MIRAAKASLDADLAPSFERLKLDRLDPDAVHRGEVAYQGAGPLDELMPGVRFASYPSARRKISA